MQVRFLIKKEINIFKRLVKKFYKKNHILSKSSKLINFYYNYNDYNKVNLIGYFKKKKLLSVLGILPFNNWDRKLKKTYFIGFWVKNPSLKNSLPIINFIFSKLKPDFLATLSIDKKTSGKIFQNFGQIKPFDNFYIKNTKEKAKISKELINSYHLTKHKVQLSITCDKKLKKLPNNPYSPKKSLKYFNNKYIKNPFYNYFLLKFYNKKNLCFFFVCREIKVKKFSTKVARVVDFYGKIKRNYSIFDSIQKFLQINHYEYIDFLNVGLKKELKEIGFTQKKKNNFLPEHFEPFEMITGSKSYCILKNASKKKIILVKGDGDGDRPNLL